MWVKADPRFLATADGRTKRMCEEILADLSVSDPRWSTMCLRYTNPSGAHPSGYIGEVSTLEPTDGLSLGC